MTTLLSITSLNQGKLNATPKSDAEYWARFADKPAPTVQGRLEGAKISWLGRLFRQGMVRI